MKVQTTLTASQCEAIDRAGFRVRRSSIRPVADHGYRYRDLFRIETAGGAAYAVKIRKPSAANVLRAISVLPLVKDTEHLLEQYTAVITDGDELILLTDWVDGLTARDAGECLPAAFAGLARLHADNPWTGELTSKYADGAVFERIEEMVEAELAALLPDLPQSVDRKRICDAVQPLKEEPSCIVHDDVNPGNVMTSRGAVTLIDCEWVHGGLSLMDFEYLDFFGTQGDRWWAIVGLADECVRSYFGELGMGASRANRQMRAFQVLQALRWNTFVRFRRDEASYGPAGETIERALERTTYL